MSGSRAFMGLLRREIVRAPRQPARLFATLGTAGLVWLVLAGGLGGSMEVERDFAAYLGPGVLAMVVLFSGIFAGVALIEDRTEGFLQAVLVSPAPTWSIAGAKIAGGGVWAWAQGLLLLPAVGLTREVSPAGLGLAALGLGALAFGAVGVCLAGAWAVRSAAGYHGIMNMVLMPMWLFSGAVFPMEGLAGWMRALTLANPMHWALRDVRALLEGEPAGLGLAAFAALGAGAALWFTAWGRGAARDRGARMDGREA